MKKIITFIFMVLLITKSSAYSKILEEEAVPVKEKILWREGRHEISPTIGWTFRDPYVRTLFTILNYTYYIRNWLGVNAEFGYGISFPTALQKHIEKELSKPGESFSLSTSNPSILALFNVNYVPIYGKFILLKKILVNYDIHLTAGIGYSKINGREKIEDSSSLATSFGIGTRFFATKWLSINFDFKDYIIKSALNSKWDASVAGKKFHNHLTILFGVSFFFPQETKFEK